MKKRINKEINSNNLYSATSLINHVRSDCIIDLIDIVKKNDYEIDNNLEIIKKKRKRDNNFTQNKKIKSAFDYIVEAGYKFEANIFDEIKQKLEENNELHILKEITEKDFYKQFLITQDTLINKTHDIIMGGLLINKSNNTYGYPDLIVSGYWMKKYINDCPVNIENKKIYYIIDVKSSTISLISGGEHVSSGLLYDGYKVQIYIYTQALNNMLNTNITIGLILGKKYKYTSMKNKIIIDNPFSRLAIIDFRYEELNGINLANEVNNAVEWKTYLKSNWQDMSLYPIENNKLHPNMKNHYDKNYNIIKKQIAFVNKEITLFWNCGTKNRNLAWESGIKCYDDEKLTPEILGINNKSSKYNILDNMLKILHSDKLVILNKSNNYNNWQKKHDYDFFVDFETYSKEKIYGENLDETIYDNINSLVIYMIGVHYTEMNKNIFKCFIIKFNGYDQSIKCLKKRKNLKCNIKSYIYCDNELDLITKFVYFINSFNKTKIATTKFYNKTRLIHWSSAEPIIFNKKITEYKLYDKKYNLAWFDLLQVFKYKDDPIIIKECFGFGLKDIVKNLNKYNLLKLQWPKLDDGLLSSFMAKEIYDSNLNNNNTNKMINIVEYNYIDCIALFKLLTWMNNYIR
jgi:hypothetical protein